MLAPALRDEYGFSLAQIGVVLAAEWAGSLVTMLLWGLLADRIGERWVLAIGLGGCAAFLAGAAFAPGYGSLVLLLVLAGAAGASVNAASGRAVMHWFSADERGFALGIRQAAVPIGGLAAAVVLPVLGGVEAGLLFLAGLCLLGALAGAIVIRDSRVHEGVDPETIPWTLRDTRLWRLCFGSGIFVVSQIAIIGFVVLYLHDERGFSTGEAGAVLAAIQLVALMLRISAGRWSDRLQARVVPLRRVGIAVAASLIVVAALLDAPRALLVAAFVLAGGLSMAWNGLAFTAAAELAGRARSGAAIGVQQSVLSVLGVAAPVAFAATVSASSWRSAYALAALFPLIGWWLLRPLAER